MLRHATCTPLASILAIVVLGGTSSILARPVSHEARAWADDVWEAALEGDRTELDELFATPASSGVQDDAR